MLKQFFLYNPFSSTRVKIFLLILFLFSFKYFILILFFLISFMFMFKKKKFSRAELESLQTGIFYSPVSGMIDFAGVGGVKKNIKIEFPFYKSFGIQMPIEANIINYILEPSKSPFKNLFSYEALLTAQTELGEVKMQFKCFIPFMKPRIWCRSGDVISAGAYIGYLPFGGKIAIELAENTNILVTKSDKTYRMQTLLCSRSNKT